MPRLFYPIEQDRSFSRWSRPERSVIISRIHQLSPDTFRRSTPDLDDGFFSLLPTEIHLRLQSFFRLVMTERADWENFPLPEPSSHIPVSTNFLYSSTCNGINLQQITCSTRHHSSWQQRQIEENSILLLTGRYLVSNAWVRRIIHRLTIWLSSSNFSWACCTSLSLPPASRPRRIGFSNLVRNSFAVPKRKRQRSASIVLFSVMDSHPECHCWRNEPNWSIPVDRSESACLREELDDDNQVWREHRRFDFRHFSIDGPDTSRWLTEKQRCCIYLITDNQADGAAMKNGTMRTECFVGDDQDRTWWTTCLGEHECL